MIQAFMKWYSGADQETISLVKRFAARMMSEQKPNEYLKKILRRELDNVVEG